MSNFEYLQEQSQYTLFSAAAIEAEKIYSTSPAMCAVGCRKALELAVKWVYSADRSIQPPYNDNLQSLIHEYTFRNTLDNNTWRKLQYIIKLGNLAVHTQRKISASDAILSLKGLFEFIQWIDYTYGYNYLQRQFKEEIIPSEKISINIKEIKKQESLILEKDAEIEKLRQEIQKISFELTLSKEKNQKERTFNPDKLSEFETRKKYIDVELKLLGWKFDSEYDADVSIEYKVYDMNNIKGQNGFVDYVLFGNDGLPLAVIEAKKTSRDPNIGRKQASLYADCLERRFKRRPIIFTTNGFETYFWDDKTSPQRKVSGLFSKDDLQKIINRRDQLRPLNKIPISDKITDRYYQKEAIRAVCDNIEQGIRKNLLVMATGTGKTRTASSLTDVLSRGNYVTNILFLADRTALVKQAKEDFKNHLPDMSLCNLCSNKDDRNARIIFSTYPTMLNAIDNCKTENDFKLFTPAHFDLIIIDESHRSIFKKYKTIFEYFDAILLGLTATPKEDVDRNTYDFFEMQNGVPTYAYDYETAVKKDHVLVPYYNYEVKTKFIENGIKYDELSDKDKDRYESDFFDEENAPYYIPSSELNKIIFNEPTIDEVLQDLMERGIKVAGGDLLGKTIIFAQNKKHAEEILNRFNKLYPQYKGSFAQRVVCEDAYAQTIIDDFKKPDSNPRIVISVDMMDTGIDVPECVNLVFFKKVRSKTKFWQMIGRGTRICPDLICFDKLEGEYIGKRRFLIFDYCSNFDYFRENQNGFPSREMKSLSENIFIKKIKIASALQGSSFIDEKYQTWRDEIIKECNEQVKALNTEIASVKSNLRYVEKYKNPDVFVYINEGNKGELISKIAPIVFIDDNDEYAKRFDNLIYGMIISRLKGDVELKKYRKSLTDIASLLENLCTISQVKEKLTEIQKINTEEYWSCGDVIIYEHTRKEVRNIIKFLADSNTIEQKSINTKLTDPVIESTEGKALNPAYDFEDYKKKVNRYIEENADSQAIYNLTHNIPLTKDDYKELERVLTEELGSKEDYRREYGDIQFGLLIRRIAKLDHQAAMNAFSAFINDSSLNHKQIAFVNKIIEYIEHNGYMDEELLSKPPFDKPISFVKLFDPKRRTEIIQTIVEVRANAMV